MYFLYDINTSKILDYPYWNYGKFDLDNLTDEERWTEFRFLKNDLFNLKNVLRIYLFICLFIYCSNIKMFN